MLNEGSQRLLKGGFFLLPFTFVLGIAVQGAGLYALGLLIPLIVLRGGRQEVSKLSYRLSACMFALWALFPLANTFAWLSFPDSLQIGSEVFQKSSLLGSNFKAKYFWESRLSSTWLSASVFLFLSGFLSSRVPHSSDLALQNQESGSARVLVPFLQGFAIALVLWGALLAVQHFTGFNTKGGILKPEHRMVNGTYRVFGFYGHPLSVASVAMAFMAYFWFLFWRLLGTPTQTLFLKVFPKLSAQKHLAAYFGISILCYLCVVMTAGRTAMVAATMIFGATPLFCARSSRIRWIGLGAIGLLSSGLMMLFFAGNFFTRFEYLISMLQKGQFENRGVFWKIYVKMIEDHPWFGSGAYFIENGLRTAYYTAFAPVKLTEKYNAHNNYLEMIANIGVVGTTAFVVLCAVAIKQIKSSVQRSRDKDLGLHFAALLAALAPNFLHGLTQNVFFDSNVLLPYMGLFLVGFWGLKSSKSG